MLRRSIRYSSRVHVHTQQKQANDFEPSIRCSESSGRGPGASLNETFKRALDIVGSLALLIALSPVMLIIAALVKVTSRGPVLFRQTRIGQRGKPFHDAEVPLDAAERRQCDSSGLRHLVHQLERKAAGRRSPVSSRSPTIRASPPIGRILRNTSLDELPQFLNVLMGQMSLVGPRPPLPYEVEQYKPWHCRRVLEAKPGITGLWQVTGRSRTTFDEMVRLDLEIRAVVLALDGYQNPPGDAEGRHFWKGRMLNALRCLHAPRACAPGK